MTDTYIQSALSLPTEREIKQEKASMLNITDSFKKIIITLDIVKMYRDKNGIITMSIHDFLLNENSLEF